MIVMMSRQQQIRKPDAYKKLAPALKEKITQPVPSKGELWRGDSLALLAEAYWRVSGDADTVLPILKHDVTTVSERTVGAVRTLMRMGDAAKPLVPEIRKAMARRAEVADGANLEATAAKAIWRLDGDIKELLRVATADLKSDDDSRKLRTIELLGEVGPVVKELVPLLVELVKAEDKVNERRTVSVTSINSMDPEDADVPGNRRNSATRMRDAIVPALKRIDPPAAKGLERPERPTIRLN